MEGERRINAWSDLELRDVVYAYRKAKADCFFDRSLHVSQEFVNYEKNLASNLKSLLAELQTGSLQAILDRNFGEYRLVPKKLSRKRRESWKGGHAYFSDPERAFEFLLKSEELTPELRLVGVFSVELHVISALWINLVGHLLDERLKGSAYGSRLRRYQTETGSSATLGEYHLGAPGSFQPYFSPYKKWRDNGFEALKNGLYKGEALVAISLDFKNYYHTIDPGFLALEGFKKFLGVELNSFEDSFTNAIAKFLHSWSGRAAMELGIYATASSDGGLVGGLPIGLSATRLIANCLLAKWDDFVERNLSPIYYGRYVDDVLLIIRDPGDIDSSGLMSLIEKRSEGLVSKSQDGGWNVLLGEEYQGASKLSFQDGKHKVFFLHGQGGLDLLESIEKEIRSVSSERRLMPDLSMLEESTAAQVLSAAGSVGDEADTLRRADGLSVRRLGWSLQLRNAETVAHDLRPEDWRQERLKFYKFAQNHILRSDRFLDHADYFPRLLSLAVALEDWDEALSLVRCSLSAVYRLQQVAASGGMDSIKINGYVTDAKRSEAWKSLVRGITEAAEEAVLRSYRWKDKAPVALTKAAQVLLGEVGITWGVPGLFAAVRDLREHDWAKVSYKDHVRRYSEKVREPESDEGSIVGCYEGLADLQEFLAISNHGEKLRLRQKEAVTVECLYPYVFSTRPYSAQEIALFVPECIRGDGVSSGAVLWAKYVRAVRGVWVRPALIEEAVGLELAARNPAMSSQSPKSDVWVVGRPSDRPVRLGITSLLTTDVSWAACAAGGSDLSPGRYRRLARLVNQCLALTPRPSHVLLPELSLPERWISSVSGRFRDAGISLIAGLDYTRVLGDRIYSEALMILSDDRLGYPSSVEIRQRKCLPAPAEEEELYVKYGQTWDQRPAQKPIYDHMGFSFGVLVCSELQSIAYRQRFQGYVDSLFVLSWNRDLETFGALVESAALDVHAYIALVNNRSYGDSRVRAPMKASHRRDLCRVRGGGDDYVVVVDVDIESLRRHQSRSKNWPRKDDIFKPVPEAFCISRRRSRSP
nr:RNA-directed DNA polymerase [uncultured Pseudoxanthomonas sp.]